MAIRSRDKKKDDKARTSGLEHQMHAQTGEMLNALDNPDDGEIFDTGDASDFAGENDRKKRKAPHR